jgi:putative spermidine/putrescine transport system ATP-binding protein
LLRKPGRAVDGPSIAGTVSGVEYQGTYVRVAIAADGGTDISAQLTESEFDAADYAVGERVLVTWDPKQASPLQASLLRTGNSLAAQSSEKAA